MKFESIDQQSFVSVVPNPENDWSSFCVEAAINLEHSQFSATNSDVALTNLARFVSQFDLFVLNRSVRPRLDGTYDTYLELRAEGRDVILSFRVGSASGAANHGLSGSFAVAEGALSPLVEAAKRLQKWPNNSLQARRP